MTIDEAKDAIEELKKDNGMTDEDIAKALYNMYRSNKIDLEQFDALARLVGFCLTEEFLKEERVN